MSTDILILDSYDAQLAAQASTEARRGLANRASDFTIPHQREIWTVFYQAAVERRNRRVTQ